MADKRLVKYIKEALIQEHDLNKVKHYLIAHNHSEKEVNEAIKEVNKHYENNDIHP